MVTKDMKIGLSSANSLQAIQNRFGVSDQRLPSQAFLCWALGPYVLEQKSVHEAVENHAAVDAFIEGRLGIDEPFFGLSFRTI